MNLFYIFDHPHTQVSVLINKKTIFLFKLNDPDNPYELAFQERYGGIINYKWLVLLFVQSYLIHGANCCRSD